MVVLCTTEEGGTWQPIQIHSLMFRNGDRWDEVNGFMPGAHMTQ